MCRTANNASAPFRLLARLVLLSVLMSWLSGCSDYADEDSSDIQNQYMNKDAGTPVMTGTWLFDDEPAGQGLVSYIQPNLLMLSNLPIRRFTDEWMAMTGESGWSVDTSHEENTFPLMCVAAPNAYSTSSQYHDLTMPDLSFHIVSADGRRAVLRVVFGKECYALKNLELSVWTVMLSVAGYVPVDNQSLPKALYNKEKTLRLTAR
jgi:hypothetical protein